MCVETKSVCEGVFVCVWCVCESGEGGEGGEGVDLLLRKREEPEQRSFPSAMMAILSPSKSASSLERVGEVVSG